MILSKLLEYDYYRDKLPLYIRQNTGICQQIEIMVEIMKMLDSTEDEVLDILNIMQENYLENVVAKYDDIDGYDFTVLDLIASLYGLNRNLTVSYDTTTKTLRLTNKELLLLIKTKIIQNNYEGSYEELQSFFNMINLPVYCFTTQSSGVVEVMMDISDVSENIKDLFLSKHLLLSSMGISYECRVVDISLIGIWSDKSVPPVRNNQWDKSRWL